MFIVTAGFWWYEINSWCIMCSWCCCFAVGVGFYLLYVFLLFWLNCYFDLFAFTVFALYVLVIFVVPPVFLSVRLHCIVLYLLFN